MDAKRLREIGEWVTSYREWVHAKEEFDGIPAMEVAIEKQLVVQRAELLAVAPEYVRQLVAYVEELHRILHDASQDGGAYLGERRERARVSVLIRDEINAGNGNSRRQRGLQRLRKNVEAGGEVSPLPYDELAAENKRLRAALEEVRRLTWDGSGLPYMESQRIVSAALEA